MAEEGEAIGGNKFAWYTCTFIEAFVHCECKVQRKGKMILYGIHKYFQMAEWKICKRYPI